MTADRPDQQPPAPSQVRWQEAGGVLWADIEVEGVRYSIAGGPRGVLLWTQGNAGTDLASVALFAGWNAAVARWSRSHVVKVRRRTHGLRWAFMRRQFPRSVPLLECVQRVEQELRRGPSPQAG